MKRMVLIATVIAIAAVVAVVAIGSRDRNSQENNTATTSQTPHQAAGSPAEEDRKTSEDEVTNVSIENHAYQPAVITIAKGTTVTWTNKDRVQHDVMPTVKSDAFPGSTLLSGGESYSFTFDTPGTYEYYCSPHTFMRGTVVVTE